MYTCLWVVDPYLEYSRAEVLAAASIAVRIWLTSLPPPVASKAKVAEVVLRALMRSVMKEDELESQTWTAPIDLSNSACSGLRTMATSGTPSSRQSFTNICPRLDAAAVWTSPRCL